MAGYVVTKPFRHTNTGKTWLPGDAFSGKPEDALELERRGYLRSEGGGPAQPGEPAGGAQGDLSQLTVRELRDKAEALGIDAPKKATKAQLASLIEGAGEAGGGDGCR